MVLKAKAKRLVISIHRLDDDSESLIDIGMEGKRKRGLKYRLV